PGHRQVVAAGDARGGAGHGRRVPGGVPADQGHRAGADVPAGPPPDRRGVRGGDRPGRGAVRGAGRPAAEPGRGGVLPVLLPPPGRGPRGPGTTADLTVPGTPRPHAPRAGWGRRSTGGPDCRGRCGREGAPHGAYAPGKQTGGSAPRGRYRLHRGRVPVTKLRPVLRRRTLPHEASFAETANPSIPPAGVSHGTKARDHRESTTGRPHPVTARGVTRAARPPGPSAATAVPGGSARPCPPPRPAS